MKNQKSINSTASKFSVLRQLCNLIPPHLVSSLAIRHGSQKHARTFSHWSQVVALMYSKLTHSFGLNDVCDALQLHSGPLAAIRGATPPARNTFSHANTTRPAQIAEDLYWAVLDDLQSRDPDFGRRRLPGRLRKLRRKISLLDSTVVQLVAKCMDWAAHRRRKAAAKCHVRLNFQSLLPEFVVVDVARQADCRRARELTAGLKSGEIVVMDRGYVDLAHFEELSRREVVWVTRMKERMLYDWLDSRAVQGDVLEDKWVVLTNGVQARLIVARVTINDEEREMTFLTNQMDWSAATVVELYKARWEIEVFFKQMKQTLRMSDLMSYNANGIRWQIWMALLVQLLMRFLQWSSCWPHTFARMYAMVRSILWRKNNIIQLLEFYGTAARRYRNRAQPEQAYLPGFG